MVRLRRLELPRVLSHSDLNAARLPVPPRPQTNYIITILNNDLYINKQINKL